MSQSDVDRFVTDLKENADMRGELKGAAAGVASVVTFAQAKGYDITADEARSYIQGQAQRELSDADLEAVAGGKGHHHSSSSTSTATQVATVQTAVAVTSEAAEAETTVEAVAEAVIVLT